MLKVELRVSDEFAYKSTPLIPKELRKRMYDALNGKVIEIPGILPIGSYIYLESYFDDSDEELIEEWDFTSQVQYYVCGKGTFIMAVTVD